MKKWFGIIIAAAILAAQTGCSHPPAGGGSAVSSRSVSSESASSQIGLKPGEAVKVSGENRDFELNGIDFLNDTSGWMIQNQYDSGSDSYRSQLVATSDGGKNWNKVGQNSRELDTVCFVGAKEGWAVSQKTSRAASADVTKLVRYSVLHTSDGGASWAVQWQSGTDESETKPALWAEKSAAFALAGSRMLQTNDGGKSWKAVAFGGRDFTPVQMNFSNAQTGWAAGVNSKKNLLSVFHTSDGGKSWNRQFQKKMDSGAAGCAGIDFLNDREGWFLTSDLATWNGELYHTADGGLHWEKTGEVKSVRPTPEGLDFTDSKTGWIPLDVGAGPINGGLMVTRDGGKSFQIFGASDQEDAEESQAVISARQIVFRTKTLGWAVGMSMNYGDYLLRTGDGGKTWSQVFPEPEPVVVFSFSTDKIGFGIGRLSDLNALLKTENGGQSWKTVTSFSGKYLPDSVSFLHEKEGWVLATPADSAGNSMAVLHTSDGGKTWGKTDLGFAPRTVSAFRFLNSKTGLLLEDNSIYRTSDGGKTWKFASSRFSTVSRQAELNRLAGDTTVWKEPAETKNVGYPAASLLPKGKGFLLADRDGENAGSELLTTSDAGKTWSPHSFPAGFGSDLFDSASGRCPMQFTDDAHGWILTARGMLATCDGGRTWVWQ